MTTTYPTEVVEALEVPSLSSLMWGDEAIVPDPVY
jgi:hypothetical protein